MSTTTPPEATRPFPPQETSWEDAPDDWGPIPVVERDLLLASITKAVDLAEEGYPAGGLETLLDALQRTGAHSSEAAWAGQLVRCYQEAIERYRACYHRAAAGETAGHLTPPISDETLVILERDGAGLPVGAVVGVPHTFEMQSLVSALRRGPEYARHGRDGVTLVRTPDLRVLLETLRRGAALGPSREAGSVTLHMLEGDLRVDSGGEVLYVRARELVTLPVDQSYALEAVTDSAFVLTLISGARIAPGSVPAGETEDAVGMSPATAQGIHPDWPPVRDRFPLQSPGAAEEE